MASDDITNQHDIDADLIDETLTPEDEDDKILEGEIGDPDELHRKAFGDEDNKPIDKEIDEDEIARVKDLTRKQQKNK
jgi:hypothetical protein